MFTKEHFERVASVLSAARKKAASTTHALSVVDTLANDFADIFAESNERFSRKAFLGACNAASRSEIRRLVQSNNVKMSVRKGSPTAQYKAEAG